MRALAEELEYPQGLAERRDDVDAGKTSCLCDQVTRVREADLQRHLENSLAKGEAPARAKPVPSVPAGEQKPVEFGSKDDFQLSQAVAFLKGEPVKSQSPTVAQTETPKQQVKPTN